MWSGDRPGRGGWREKLGRPSNFWLNEWVGSNAERRTEAKKQVGEQSVGSVWGVKAEGLQDRQVLWVLGWISELWGSHLIPMMSQLHSQGLALFPGDSCCSV